MHDPSDHICHASVLDNYLVMSAKYIVTLLPDAKPFERVHKYISDPPLIPKFQWTNPGTSVEQKTPKKLRKSARHKARYI